MRADHGEDAAETDDAGTTSSHIAWTVGAVARRLGVSPSTLRSWSHRYGIGPETHQPGRHRRYSEHDVADLELMCRLVSQGVAAGAAATVVEARRHEPEPEGVHAPTPPDDDATVVEPGTESEEVDHPPPSPSVDALVRAARRLDAAGLLTALRAHLADDGVLGTWDGLCRPALAVLDRQVVRTGECIDAELVLAWAVITAFRELVAAPRVTVAALPRVLLACTDGEQHTLALEALHAALAEAEVSAQMMGASVPDSALSNAATRMCPDVVVLWAQTVERARVAAVTAVTAMSGAVVAAGPGWDPDALPDPVTVARTLADALADIECRVAPSVAGQRPRPPQERAVAPSRSTSGAG